MPIFEYVCQECEHRFEAIVLGSKSPKCPKCESKRLNQQLSRFSVAGGRTSELSSSGADEMGACGTCGDPNGPGSCAMDDVD